MKHLVVGISYRTAGVDLLGKLSVQTAELHEVLDTLFEQPSVTEAVVLSTCNRVEVYAAVTDPTAAVTEIATVLAGWGDLLPEDVLKCAYWWHGDQAVRHVYRVACGLDSLVLGDGQILGQLRGAYKAAVDHGAAGSVSHQLFQATLRVSKRIHAETGIDRVSGTLVGAALDFGSRISGIDPAGASVLIIGAGKMGSLALATLHRAGAGTLAVANRSLERIEKLSELYGVVPVALSDLREALRTADIVVSAMSMPGFLLSSEVLDDRPRLLIDLGMPRNIDPTVGELAGVSLVGIAELGEALAGNQGAAVEIVAAAEAVVGAAEVMIEAGIEEYSASRRSRRIGPVLAALRRHADEVIATELRGFTNKRSELSEEVHADVSRAVHRIVQRLLHQPSVSARKLAAEPGGEQYATLLCELFALESAKVA